MAKKVLYLGNGKWCWTEACKRHASTIADKNSYLKAVASGDEKAILAASQKLVSTEEGKATFFYLKVQSLKEATGRQLTIGLDLDGTTGDFTDGLRNYMGKVSKLNIAPADWKTHFPDPADYAMWKGEGAWYTSREDFLNHFQEAERKGIYRDIPVYPTASKVLHELRNYGFNIKAVTARGAEFNEDTSEWMRKHNIPVSALLNPGTNKQTVPNIDLYIDDAPHVVNQLLEHNKTVLVMNQSYNTKDIAEHDNAKRVSNWDDNVVEAIFQLLDKRKKN